jgi:hypothetical protein
LIAPGRASTGKQVVDEHDAVADKTVVADGNQFANEGVGLDFRSIADPDTFLYLDEWTDERIISDLASVHVDGFNDGYVFTEFDIADGDPFNSWFH